MWSNCMVRTSGLPFLDLDLIWGAGTTPNSFNPAYDCGDGIHPNGKGLTVAATQVRLPSGLSTVLQRILNI